MTIIAREGEKIKGRDGKVIATVAQDIHSGDLNLRPSQFIMSAEDRQSAALGGFIPEEIMEFIRYRLGNPPPEPDEPKPARKVRGKGKR